MAVEEAAETTTPTRRLPGVEGIWVFLGVDSVIFLLLFGSFVSARHADPVLFETSRQALNRTLGGLDTLILLTSSWQVALGIKALRHDELDRAPRFLLGGWLLGLAFMVSKSVEYGEKLVSGITPGTNLFYSWYFILTGVHLLHVIGGTTALVLVWSRARRYGSGARLVPESVASFWHLVDLLWIMIFPLLYLMR